MNCRIELLPCPSVTRTVVACPIHCKSAAGTEVTSSGSSATVSDTDTHYTTQLSSPKPGRLVPTARLSASPAARPPSRCAKGLRECSVLFCSRRSYLLCRSPWPTPGVAYPTPNTQGRTCYDMIGLFPFYSNYLSTVFMLGQGTELPSTGWESCHSWHSSGVVAWMCASC